LLASYAAAQEEKHETTINLAAAVLCHMACNAATAQVMAKTHKLCRGTWGKFRKINLAEVALHCHKQCSNMQAMQQHKEKKIIKAINLVAAVWHHKQCKNMQTALQHKGKNKNKTINIGDIALYCVTASNVASC